MRRRDKVVLSPIERKAEFAKHATLKGKPVSRAAEEDIEISWTHLRECFEGLRTPSPRVATGVAEYVGMQPEEFWGPAQSLAAAS